MEELTSWFMIQTMTSSLESVSAYVEGLNEISILHIFPYANYLPEPCPDDGLVSGHHLEELLDLRILI
jgi:hypothetical protein